MSSAPAVSPPPAAAPGPVPAVPPLMRMFHFLRHGRGQAVFCLFLLVCSVAADIGGVKMVAPAVDAIKALLVNPAAHPSLEAWFDSGDPAVHTLLLSIAGIFGFRVLSGILVYLRNTREMKLTMILLFHLRQAIYHKLQIVGFSFHDRMTSGQLINRALTDLQQVRTFMVHSLLAGLEMFVRIGMWAVVICWINPWLLLAMVIPLPLWVWVLSRFARAARPVYEAQMKAGDEVVRKLTENAEGVQVVKAFASQPREITQYDQRCEEQRRRLVDGALVAQTYVPLIRIIAIGTNIAMFIVGCFLVLQNRMSVGDLIVISAATQQILGQLQVIQMLTDQYQRAKVSAGRVSEIMDAPIHPPEPADAKPLTVTNGTVTFENVTFGYDPRRPLLHKVNFTAPGGRITAVVGPTGSGKSTLLSLLERFYEPNQGRILIDGQDLRQVTLSSLRRNVGFVFQETFLFSQTVRENICHARPDATEVMLQTAVEIADCAEFIQKLPKKFDTVLGERGVSLSGGQRQRLAIARAILGDPKLLILDDALAAVDPATETQILTLLDLVMAGRTVFVIANRLSTVQRADLVLVMQHGRIIQQGRHADLLEQPGYYRDVAMLQLQVSQEQL